MKTLRIFSFLAVIMAITNLSFGQTLKSETIPVSGNCGMCKSTIEKAAKKAGAEKAVWDMDAKTLLLVYNSESTDAAKIQQGIAAAGYDTRDVRADDKAYGKLPPCCKYERSGETKLSCCETGKCAKAGCCAGEKM
jgi:mercuric ion binding protein